MQYLGELISICVAISWTFTALFFEFAGKRVGSLSVNLFRLLFAFFLLGSMLYFTTGSFLPSHTDSRTWIWMSLSGLVGFVFGDMCLFYSYILITARFSQLLMTLAPPSAALFGWLLLGEKLSYMALLGMTVTLFGIAISILKKEKPGQTRDTLVAGASNLTVVTGMDKERKGIFPNWKPGISMGLPVKGVLLGIGGALGQGLGIVLSKKGMGFYTAAAEGSEIVQYIPFAATHIRIITGIIGFTAVILLTGKFGALRMAIKDKKAQGAIFMGSIFGPFIGVSLSLMAVQHTNTAIASTIMAMTPIFILVPYLLIYKKKITLVEVAGAILSVAGVSLFFL